jgi:hypothetical protein
VKKPSTGYILIHGGLFELFAIAAACATLLRVEDAGWTAPHGRSYLFPTAVSDTVVQTAVRVYEIYLISVHHQGNPGEILGNPGSVRVCPCLCLTPASFRVGCPAQPATVPTGDPVAGQKN